MMCIRDSAARYYPALTCNICRCPELPSRLEIITLKCFSEQSFVRLRRVPGSMTTVRCNVASSAVSMAIVTYGATPYTDLDKQLDFYKLAQSEKTHIGLQSMTLASRPKQRLHCITVAIVISTETPGFH